MWYIVPFHYPQQWSHDSASMLRYKYFASLVNLLAPEFIFLILALPVYKMWIIQEPNTLELWNKLHFEEKKDGEYIPRLKYSVPIFVE